MKGAFRGIQYNFYPIMIFYKKLHTTELFFTNLQVFQAFNKIYTFIFATYFPNGKNVLCCY